MFDEPTYADRFDSYRLQKSGSSGLNLNLSEMAPNAYSYSNTGGIVTPKRGDHNLSDNDSHMINYQQKGDEHKIKQSVEGQYYPTIRNQDRTTKLL